MLQGTVLKRTPDKRSVALWKPGDTVCRLDRSLRPTAKCSFVAVAGAAHGVLRTLECLREGMRADELQETSDLRHERAEAAAQAAARRVEQERLAALERTRVAARAFWQRALAAATKPTSAAAGVAEEAATNDEGAAVTPGRDTPLPEGGR